MWATPMRSITRRNISFLTRIDGIDGAERIWPQLDIDCATKLDLSHSFTSTNEEDRFAAKIFVRSPKSKSVEIVIGKTKERLTLNYDPQEVAVDLHS